MGFGIRKSRALVALAGLVACSSPPATEPIEPTEPTEPAEPSERARRVLAPIGAGISYGPYRVGQRPGGPDPSDAEILEDLRLLAPRWSAIRIYGARAPAEAIVRLIRDHKLPIQVMVGAWIAPEPDKAAENRAEVAAAIELATRYPDQVLAISVGNESQVFWSGHRVKSEVLIRYIRQVRSRIEQPVTTADDYNFWNKPASRAVAGEIDFLVLHAYAMWNKQTIDTALSWTREQVEAIRRIHPALTVVLGETGWATELDPNAGGDQRTQVVGTASEENQRRFHRGFVELAGELDLPYFYFEAFDEPWKGGEHPSEIEKHWGLYRVDRTPKLAISADESPVTP